MKRNVFYWDGLDKEMITVVVEMDKEMIERLSEHLDGISIDDVDGCESVLEIVGDILNEAEKGMT